MKKNKKWFKNLWEIKFILPLLFVVLILFVTFFITLLSYKLYQEHFINNLMKEHVNTLSQVNNNIEKIKDEIITVSDMFYNDSTLENILRSDNKKELDSHSDSYLYVQNLDQQIHSLLTHYSFEYEIQLMGENGFIYSTDRSKTDIMKQYKDELWYYNASDSENALYWLSSLQIRADQAYEQNFFSLMRFFKDSTGKILGLLMVNVPEEVLFATYADLISENDGNIYIVDKNGQIVSHKEKYMIGHYYYKMSKFYELFNKNSTATIFKSDVPYLFAKYENNNSTWIVVEEIPFSSVQDPFMRITRQIFLIIIFISLAIICIAVCVSLYISKQISTVCQSMEKANNGDFNVIFPKKGFREIEIISESCENFIIQITNLLNDIKKKEHIKRITELRFYQMQINPHFMHNTLFTIKCMVDMNRKDNACKMLDALNSMLKSILNTEQKLVTIQEEIETLKNYTYILQQRYANAFKIIFNIAPECNDMLILRFILQPILENSVFHGFSNNRANGIIVVTITAIENDICLCVKDNGKGIDPNILSQILNNTSDNDQHIGISNIRSRLKLHYNDKSTFEIYSKPGEGCETRITVPQYKIN